MPPGQAATPAQPTAAAVRVAREYPADGQYAVVAEDARLELAPLTITLSSHGKTLLHVALFSTRLGASGSKLMVVPLDRSPAWLVEFASAADAAACVDALAARGIEVVRGGERPAAPPPARLDDEELVALTQTPSFRAQLAEMEGCLARRRSLGLPDLLS